MESYLRILKSAMSGELSGNRTDTRAYRTTGEMFKHDMRTGFPLITTKKVNPTTVFTELEFFIKGLSDKQWLKDRKCNIWNEWCNPEKVPYGHDEDTKRKMSEENDLGEVYGYIWNSWDQYNRIVAVDKITVANDNHILKYPLFDKVPSVTPDVYNSTKYGSYYIISLPHMINGRTCCDIQFELTGYIKRSVRVDVIKQGNVKDPYYPNVYGKGYMGEITLQNNTLNKSLYKIWSHMIARCYSTSCKEYKFYGGNGIFVVNRWHSFANFYSDVQKLPGWHAKQRYIWLYDLDKDYYGGNCYSPITCSWVPTPHNILYRNSKPFYAISPDGNRSLHISQADCARQYGLIPSKISKVLLGNGKTHKGYTFEPIYDTTLYRYAHPINQLKNVIDTLKTNPTDRRMIVSAWNPSKLHKQALPPCHYAFQILSDGTNVDLVWQQRSVDIFLGLPFNIASYAMLLSLIAKSVGMTPRYLVGQLADVHLYENHMEQALEQLSRTPYPLPTLELNFEGDLFDWTADKYSLLNYQHHPFIKAPIAV